MRDSLQFDPKFGAGQNAFDALQRLLDADDPGYRRLPTRRVAAANRACVRHTMVAAPASAVTACPRFALPAPVPCPRR